MKICFSSLLFIAIYLVAVVLQSSLASENLSKPDAVIESTYSVHSGDSESGEREFFLTHSLAILNIEPKQINLHKDHLDSKIIHQLRLSSRYISIPPPFKVS